MIVRRCRWGSMVAVAVAAVAVGAAISVPATQAQAASGTALKTPWGESDLQGIWTDQFDTPLQRSAKYANREFFTAIQREELDKQRAPHYSSGDSLRTPAPAHPLNATDNHTFFFAIKPTAARNSLL